MATSAFTPGDIEKQAFFSTKRIALLVSEWNKEVTYPMQDGAFQTLTSKGIPDSQIFVKTVPGSYELSLGAQRIAREPIIDGIICLGCIIKGETPHFDYICQAVSMGISEVGLKYNKPVIFGVLTTNDQQQAKDRAGGKLGNKGSEAAIAVLKMLDLFENPL